MAAQTDPNGNDMPAHAESYSKFLGWLKIGTISSAIIAAIVVLLISR